MGRRSVEVLARDIDSLPRPLLLACDVDGTLAPIVDDPQAARVPAAVARDLRRLARRPGLRLALVTGRDAGALARVVRVPGAWRAVEHGAHVLSPGTGALRRSVSAEQRHALDELSAWARRHALPAGAELEAKPASRAIHVRELARRSRARAEALLSRAAAEARRLGLSPRPGRMVLEAEVAAHAGDKGEALARLYRSTRARSVVYVGDDLTDVPAIRRAVALGGLGLFVRSDERPRAPRGASGSLRGTDEVAELLALLAR